MAKADVLELLGKLTQMVQHLRRQFTPHSSTYVNLNDGVEKLVNLLKHFNTLLLVLLDCL
jgi:hypothetical protein